MEEGMDLESMKRRDLQELCKKHGIPANSTTSEMIERLRSLFQAEKNPKRRGCLKGSSGSSGEGSKKVTFVLEEEEGPGILGFERNPGEKSSRKCEVRVLEAPVRSTRSRGLAESVVWSPVIEKRRTRGGAEAVCENSEEAETGVRRGKRPRNASEAAGQKKQKKQEVVSEVSARITRRTTRNSSNSLDEEAASSDVENVAEEKPLRRGGKRSEAVTARRTTRNSSNLLDEEAVSSDFENVKKEKPLRQGKCGESIAAEPARRTTRSSSSSLDEEAVSSDFENIKKGKLPRRGKRSEVVAAEPVRRTMRSSSNLLEEPYYDKPVTQVKAQDSNAETEPIRRLTRSSVNLIEDKVSLPVRKDKLLKHVPEGKESAVSVSDVGAVITKRSTRSSSKILDDENSLLGFGKPQKREKEHAEVPMSDTEAVVSATRRTRSSSRVKQDEKSLPAIEEAQKQAKKCVSRRAESEVSVSESQAVISPTKRTTRGSSRVLEDEKSLPVLGKAHEQAKKHVTVSDSESVISPTKRLTRGSSRMLADENSQPVVGKLGAKAVRNKSGKQARKVGDSEGSLSGTEAVTEPTRRTTRNSSMPKLAADQKVGNKSVREGKSSNKSKIHASKTGVLAASVGNKSKAVGNDKSQKKAKSVHSGQGVSRSPVSISGEVQEKSPKVAVPKEGSRGSRRNASVGNESKQEITSPMNGNGKRKKIQEQHGEQDHKQAASKASVSHPKRQAELEVSEVPKNFNESTRRTTRSASKHGVSHTMMVGTSDEDVERSSKRKRTRAGTLEDASVKRRESVELGALGIQNAGSRSSSRVRNTPTESDIVQRESSANTDTRIQDSSLKQSSQMRETKDDRKLSSSVNHETKDHPSGLHEVMDATENVPLPCPGPALTIDLSVAVETNDPGNEVNEKNVSRGNHETKDRPSELREVMDTTENVSLLCPGPALTIDLSTAVETNDPGNEVNDVNEKNVSSGNHETKDHPSELHEVVDTTENVSLPCPGPALTIDLSVAVETNVPGNEVNDVNEKNVSEVLHSPEPVQLLENQYPQVQELYDDRKHSSGNHETEDQNIISGDEAKGSVSRDIVKDSEYISCPEQSSGAFSVDLYVADETHGALDVVNDVIVANDSQVQQSPMADKSLEDKRFLSERADNSEQHSPKQELKDDGQVTPTSNQKMGDHDIVCRDQAGDATARKDLGIADTEVSDANKKSMSEVLQSPASIQLQEVENSIFEGSHNAMHDPSTSDNQYENVGVTLSLARNNTGEVSDLPRASHSEMENCEPGLGEAAKVSEETPAVSSPQSSGAGVEEVKETRQSPTSFPEPEVLPSSRSESPVFGICLFEPVSDRGSEQAGLDCGSINVSKETSCSSNTRLSGAAGVGSVGNQDDELTESSFHSVDMQSIAYSVTTKGTGAPTDEQVEAKSTPGVHLHSSDEQVAAEFLSSIAMGAKVFINQKCAAVHLAHFVNNNNPGDITQGTVETEGVPLEGTAGATSLTHAETSVTQSRTPDAEKVVHDLSSACVSGGLDGEVMHFSDQQRDPRRLSSGVVSDVNSPNLAPTEYKVVTLVTEKPADELVDAKLSQNNELADVEEIESRGSLKGEANDDYEDMPVEEHGDASDLQEAHEISGEPQPTVFSSHGTSKSPECQGSPPRENNFLPVEDVQKSENVLFYEEHMEKENVQATSTEGKLAEEDAKIEDDNGTVKGDNISVEKFEEVQEQCDTFSLTPLYRVRFGTTEATSSASLETPACQVPSLHKEKVIISDGFTDQENVDNPSGEKLRFSSEDLRSTVSPSINVREDRVPSLHKEKVVIFDGFTDQENVDNTSGGKLRFSSEDLRSTVSPSINVREDRALLCTAHVLKEQEGKLIERNNADEDVSPTKAEGLLEATTNVGNSMLCLASRNDNMYKKSPPASGQSLVGLQEQVSAGKKTDSATEYTHYEVDNPISGMAQYETLEVEKRAPKSRQSSVGGQDPASAEIKEFSAIGDENTQPTSERSLGGLQVQVNTDIGRGSTIRTDDLADKALGAKDTMELLFGHLHYSPHEDDSTRYTECSEGKLDCWGFGDMTDGGINLTEVGYELNYKEHIQDDLGVSNKRQGELDIFEHAPVVSRSMQPNIEEAGLPLMHLEEFFYMHSEEKLRITDSRNHLEANSTKEAGEREEMNATACFAKSSDTGVENISVSSLVQERKNLDEAVDMVKKDEG